ncbi:hypothetical protein C8J56DRAFT_910366 [Mycena floridula]|nr:hypothetical protein C8J56DRAFT_910366 [Mycena floridula]
MSLASSFEHFLRNMAIHLASTFIDDCIHAHARLRAFNKKRLDEFALSYWKSRVCPADSGLYLTEKFGPPIQPVPSSTVQADTFVQPSSSMIDTGNPNNNSRIITRASSPASKTKLKTDNVFCSLPAQVILLLLSCILAFYGLMARAMNVMILTTGDSLGVILWKDLQMEADFTTFFEEKMTTSTLILLYSGLWVLAINTVLDKATGTWNTVDIFGLNVLSITPLANLMLFFIGSLARAFYQSEHRAKATRLVSSTDGDDNVLMTDSQDDFSSLEPVDGTITDGDVSVVPVEVDVDVTFETAADSSTDTVVTDMSDDSEDKLVLRPSTQAAVESNNPKVSFLATLNPEAPAFRRPLSRIYVQRGRGLNHLVSHFLALGPSKIKISGPTNENLDPLQQVASANQQISVDQTWRETRTRRKLQEGW